MIITINTKFGTEMKLLMDKDQATKLSRDFKVKLKYLKYEYVSNMRIHNMFRSEIKINFADIPYESQISAE